MIRNEYKITWKVYRSWGLENAFKGAQLLFAIFWVVLALLILVLDISSGGWFFYHYFFLFCIYRAFFRWMVRTNAQYRALAKQRNGADWLRKISFEEDTIRLEDGNVSVVYDYSDIVEIKEKGNKVWLNASDKAVIRLYKDCFIDSTWEECKSWIEEKRSRESKSEAVEGKNEI